MFRKVGLEVIRSRKDFLQTQRLGRRYSGSYLTLIVYGDGADETSRVGFTVSKKVGNAVVRNRVKRRLRALTRANATLYLAGADHVFIARPSAGSVQFNDLSADVACLLKSIKK